MVDRTYFPIERLQPGRRAIVRQITGGKEFAGRLAAIGLGVGVRVEVLQNTRHGPLLVRALDTRIALGRDEALKILVEESGDEPADG